MALGSMSDYEDARLMSQVLDLYYNRDHTQAEVARRLDASTSTVSRLLKRAREQGMVEFVIHTPFQHILELEQRLQAVFGIQHALVIPSIAEDGSTMRHTLGRAGASVLMRHLREGVVIAISGGTSVHAVVQTVETSRSYDVEVVPFLGGVQGRVTTDMNYLATELARRLGGKAYQLHAPAFVDTQEERDLLLSVRPVRQVLDTARNADVVLTGVGTVKPEVSRFVDFTALSVDEMSRIGELGGVGEIGAHVYDNRGRLCAAEYSERVVGLTLDELDQIPLKIGVAATQTKSWPLYGALRGGHLDQLVIDEAAARGILHLFDEEFRRPPPADCSGAGGGSRDSR